MLPDLNNFIQLKWNLYFADIIDIIIIALLIYSFFIFIRRTRSYLIFLGLAITVGLYLLADALNLYLTLLSLRYFVGVSIIIFVIIFQNELRKYFEFIGLIGSRQIRPRRFTSEMTVAGEIIQSAVAMAHEKVGALIVIQGRDSLDSYIEGGTAADAIVSEEILESIFDPHSDGHDGAVVIHNNRITRFGAHLPLSTNFKALGKKGTRHSSALGLSEVTDAFCIVVSEEKGKISICRDGKINTLSDYADLEKHFKKFVDEKFGNTSENRLIHLFKYDFSLKLLSTLFALIIWFMFAYQTGIVDSTFTVPINLIQVPENIVIENYSPKEVSITLSGRGDSAFSNINKDDLKINLSAADLNSGINEKSITRKNLELPKYVTIKSIEPEKILLSANKFNKVEIPVTTRVTGEPADDLEISEVATTPDRISVWVLEGEKAPDEILTENINVSRLEESAILPVKLVIPDDIRLANGEGNVSVAITLE